MQLIDLAVLLVAAGAEEEEQEDKLWALSVVVKLAAALKVYATRSFQTPSGDVCDISQSAIHNCVKEVMGARTGQYLKFDLDQDQQEARAAGFVTIAGKPNAQGAIDCTHVTLKAPLQNP